MTYDLIENVFAWPDALAVVLAVLAWVVVGWVIEHPPASHPSVTVLVSQYRRDWMITFLNRNHRIFDAQILSSLRQGTAFFASSSILAIGGVVALMGNPDPINTVAVDLALAQIPAVVWQIKLTFVGLFLIIAFLKFAWANRLFGYCAVIMGSVSDDADDPQARDRAEMAGEINVRAALNFNRGLRAMYFALAALGWLIGPIVLMVTVAATVWTLASREFSSLSNRLMQKEP